MEPRAVLGLKYLRKENLQYELRVRGESDEGSVSELCQKLRSVLDRPVNLSEETIGTVLLAAAAVVAAVAQPATSAADDVGQRGGVPVAAIYPYAASPYYYWPYYVPATAIPEVAPSDVSIPAYYTLPYAYAYPYYTPVVAAAPSLKASVYYGSWHQ